MIIFPAIDIKNKSVIRLQQGDFDKVTEYSRDLLSVANHWKEQGAEWLHIVDLDGAETQGQKTNIDSILRIAREIALPIQTGGGVRSEEDITRLLSGGISRVILGTKAITDKEFLREIIARFQNKIAVSLDCSDGYLTKIGWKEKVDIKATDFVKELQAMGLSCLIYTDVARDGMLSGPNMGALEELLTKTNIPVIASGGVSNIEDVKRLKKLESKGICGVITGKAIYEKTLDLKEAIKIGKTASSC